MPYLAVDGVGLGVGWGSGPLGAATRSPRRRRPFHFFSRLGLFWRFGRLGFLGHGRRRRTDETGLPPDPLLRTENRQFFIANFFGDFNKAPENPDFGTPENPRRRALARSTDDIKLDPTKQKGRSKRSRTETQRAHY